MIRLNIKKCQCIAGRAGDVRAVHRIGAVVTPLISQGRIAKCSDGERGALPQRHPKAGRLGCDLRRHEDRQVHHGARHRPVIVFHHHEVTAGVVRPRAALRERDVGAATAHLGAVEIPLILQIRRADGSDGKRRGVALSDCQTLRLVGDGRRDIDGQRHHRAGHAAAEIREGHKDIPSLRGLDVAQGQRGSGRPGDISDISGAGVVGNVRAVHQISAFEIPLIARRRRAAAGHGESRGLKLHDRRALWITRYAWRHIDGQNGRCAGDGTAQTSNHHIVVGGGARDYIGDRKCFGDAGCTPHSGTVSIPLIGERSGTSRADTERYGISHVRRETLRLVGDDGWKIDGQRRVGTHHRTPVVNHRDSIVAGLIRLHIGKRQNITNGTGNIRAVHRVGSVVTPLVTQWRITKRPDGERGALPQRHPKTGRLRCNPCRHQHRQVHHGARHRAVIVFHHHEVTAGVVRPRAALRERDVGAATAHLGAVEIPLILQIRRADGSDGKRRGVALSDCQTLRLVGDGRRDIDGQRHHRTGDASGVVRDDHKDVAGLSGLHIAQRQRGIRGAGNIWTVYNICSVDIPLIAERRRAIIICHDEERNIRALQHRLVPRLRLDSR